MAITRLNEFRAREGESRALLERLSAVLPTIQATPGCLSCRLLQGVDEPERIVVVEEWESIEAHQASLKAMTPADFEPVVRLLASPPSGAYFRS